MLGPAYWLPLTPPAQALESPLMAPLLYAGPWVAFAAARGGSLVVWKDFPEVGAFGSRVFEDYEEPVELEPGLHYLHPRQAPGIYDLAQGSGAGVDVRLHNGLVVTIPCALVTGRQLVLGRAGGGGLVTEYGQLAHELLAIASQKDEHGKARGLPAVEAPRLGRLLALAIGQRYRSTPELLDRLRLIAEDDVDPLLEAIWVGDPKASPPASDGGRQPSSPTASPTSP